MKQKLASPKKWHHLTKSNRAALLAIIATLALPSCKSMPNYRGPTMRFSVGWEGIDIGITLVGKPGMTQEEMMEKMRQLPQFTEQPTSLAK